DKDGNLFVISSKGDVIGKIKIKDAHEKDTRLCFFDVNKDKKDEIIVYGGGNNIYCYSSSFSILPGFPVKGSFKPNFADFNGDGEYEMVVSSFDKNIYVYSIPND
ncbi:MAG TPA: hypothetical protein PLO89_00605, partial [Spirochaetota bacterium]|nr:hypothetical protein [Spirochaetota bacterium]